MAKNRVYNLILDGVLLPLHLPIESLVYMGVPIELPAVGTSAIVNGKVRNVAGYNHRLYAEFSTSEIAISQDLMDIQAVEDGISFKQNDRIRTLWFPSNMHGSVRVRSGQIITHLNGGQWHHLRFSTKDKTIILPDGRTSVYFRFDQKWSLQLDALIPSKT